MKGGVPWCREAISTLMRAQKMTDRQTERRGKKSIKCVENYCTKPIHDTCSINQAATVFTTFQISRTTLSFFGHPLIFLKMSCGNEMNIGVIRIFLQDILKLEIIYSIKLNLNRYYFKNSTHHFYLFIAIIFGERPTLIFI